MQKKFLEYGLIMLGSLLIAATVNLVIIPLEMASGGLGGLTVILEYLWKVPNGPLYFAINVPLIVLLWRLYGLRGLAKTIIGMSTYSVGMVLLRPLQAYAPTHELLLASLLGGFGLGLGIALVVIAGGSIGGNSSLAKVLYHYFRWDLAKQILIIDIAVLVWAALVFSVEKALYAVVMSVVTNRVMQAITEGLNTARTVLIIGQNPDVLGQAITSELKRGCTRLAAHGEWTKQERPVLLVVISESELRTLDRIVHEIEPNAFMIVQEAREVRGYGFTLEHELRSVPFWIKNMH
ncbi:MAG TPA: YitT family protein [Symbiobacteriaceae bacterium]|nr:YitT family protein [Symbiobacteriaceae bacterium]